jgi:hypothetical protein
MEAAAERLALLYLNIYLWPLHWLGVGEAWVRWLGRALVVLAVLSCLLLPLSPAPLEAFLQMLFLPQQVPRLLGMLHALVVCALG